MKKLIFCFLFLFFSFWTKSVYASPWTLSWATFVVRNTFSSSTTPTYMGFNSDWTKLFLLNTNLIRRFDCSTAFSGSTCSYASSSYNPWISSYWFIINSTWTKYWLQFAGTIYEYSLSVAYSLATSTLVTSKVLTTADSILFNNSWTLFYIGRNNIIYTYSCSIAYSISTCTLLYTNTISSISNTVMRWMYFSTDWSLLFLFNNDWIYHFNLTTNFLISSWSRYSSIPLTFSPSPYLMAWLSFNLNYSNFFFGRSDASNNLVIDTYTTNSIFGYNWALIIGSPTPTRSWVIYRLYQATLNWYSFSSWVDSVLRFQITWSWLAPIITSETYGFWYDYQQLVEFPYHPSTSNNPYTIVPYVQALTWSLCLTYPWCWIDWASYKYSIVIAEQRAILDSGSGWSNFWSQVTWYDPAIFNWDKNGDWEVSFWEFFSWLWNFIKYIFQKIIDFFVNIYSLVQQLWTIFSSDIKTFSLIPETYAIDEHSLPNSFKFTWMQTGFDSTWMWKMVIFLKAFLAFICFGMWLGVFVYLNKK